MIKQFSKVKLKGRLLFLIGTIIFVIMGINLVLNSSSLA